MSIRQGKEEQVIEYHSKGRRFQKNAGVFILFNEPVLEINQENRVTIIIKDNKLTIIRNGLNEMRQVYLLNEVTYGYYQTQYGKIELTVFTKSFTYEEDKLTLTYDIINDGLVVGSYDLSIDIKE